MKETVLRGLRRWRKPLIVTAVVAAHLAVFAMIARTQPTPRQYAPPPFDVFMVRPERPKPPEPPPPPPPPPEPAAVVGGGRPAAPSRVHATVNPPPTPPEITAPLTPAPTQPLIIGAAADTSPTPGQGQGGEGTGDGGGSGAGSGPGSGTVRARLISAPSARDLSRLHPAGPGSGAPGRVSVTCRVRLDTQMEACRVTSETPPGQGFGAAGQQAAMLYRFQPPSRGGRPETGEMTVIINFGRPGR